jgi:hypothetical protein
VELTVGPIHPRPLAQRYPLVRHVMATVLLGGGTLEEELVDYVQGVSSEDVVRSIIAKIRALLADPEATDDAIDTFLLDNAQRFVAGSGRRTLEHVADRFQPLLEDSGRRTVEQVVAVLRRRAVPLGHDEAKVLAEMLLDRDKRPAHQGEIVIVDEHTQESDTTWAFVFNSRDYVETGSFLDMIVGNAPILVDKATGRTRVGRSDLSVAEQI